MFDVATRYSPNNPLYAGLAIPFDWVLSQPTSASVSTASYQDPCASVQPKNQVLALQVYALGLEASLQTAILISLFTNQRAGIDVPLPLGQRNRQGWVGSEFTRSAQGNAGDDWGSLLWTVLVSKSTTEVLERARFYAAESLAWMVRDGIAQRVVVDAEWHGEVSQRLALRVKLYQSAAGALNADLKPVYDVLWGTSIARGATPIQATAGLNLR